MNSEINSPDDNTKDESAENENGLDESIKSNGFLYVDINDYNENNLDGIEIKEEEEQVEDFTLEKHGTEAHEIYFEENLPLNSLKNLANHSQSESKLGEICNKNKAKKTRELSNKFVQKENILEKDRFLNENEENSKSRRYKLRARTWSQKIDLNLSENAVKRKKRVESPQKRTSVCTRRGVSFSKRKISNHETEGTNFECLNCKRYFCTGNSLDAHLKVCKHKKNNKSLRNRTTSNQISLKKYSENQRKIFFKCDKCSTSFAEKHDLVSHILKNECDSKIYTCAICEETFIKKSSLRKHIIAHLKNQLQCQYCFQISESHKSLNSHSCTQEISDKKTYCGCSVNCEVKFQLSKNDSVSCECSNYNESNGSQKFIDNQSFKLSCLTVYKCQACKKVFKGVIAYRNHLKSHRDDVIKCNTTNGNPNNSSSKFSSHADAGKWQKSISKSKKKLRYECDICGKGFTKLLKLKIHILNVHQDVDYQGEKCSVNFPNQEDLDIHLNKQDCKSDFCTCKTCGKVFAKKDYLKKHQYMHLNVLFKCKYCYCAFVKEKSYKKHMEKMNCSKSARRIRMTEFNFKKCRFCEIEYETEELLIKHFRASHVGVEPHQCFCCDLCLPSFRDLENHIHQHNIQKYTCNLCGKPYTSQEGFRKHRLKHKGAEFKCKFCESEFLNEGRFKFHEKTCKKNPDSGYEPSQEKEKPKKKSDKPKQSRQLHWESRIILKRLRGDPKLLAGNQTNSWSDQLGNNVSSTFFDEPETDTADDRGWFNNYYKTDEDDFAFGLKKADELQDCESDLDVTEFLRTSSVTKKKETSSATPKVVSTVNSNAAEDCEMDAVVDNQSESSSEDSSTDSDEEIKNADLPIDYNPKNCRLCMINFGQEYELLHHFIKTHPGEFAHKCPQCDIQSPLFAQLKEHLKTHGIGIGIFNCDNCSKQFKNEKKLNSHSIRCKGINNKNGTSDQKLPSQSRNEDCKRCGKKFHSKFGFRRHKQLCKKRKNKIKNSEKITDDPTKLGAKEETMTDNITEGNDFQFSDSEEALKVNNEQIPQSAHLDGNEKAKSKKQTAAKSHVDEKKKEENQNSYTGEPPMDSFPCRLCDKKFQYERGIVMHFKSAHPGHKPLICHVCNMHLADKLKEHLKTHGIGEEFICELCGKRFNQKFLSKIHEMWHQGIEYKCNNCKQKFLNKEKMEKHIGENRCSNRQSLMRLPCDICGKSYRSKFGLSKHYITHTPKELRPVKNRMNCEYCGKWFEYNNGLQRHRRIHTGERPFCCRFCPKAFAQEGNCKAHERIHTGESKPRKKKLSAVPVSSTVSSDLRESPVSSQLPSVPPSLPPASTVESITYPSHINLYIYNNIDPSAIAH